MAEVGRFSQVVQATDQSGRAFSPRSGINDSGFLPATLCLQARILAADSGTSQDVRWSSAGREERITRHGS